MSLGPSALGTVLLQRLDAAMGVTLGAHANLVSGARPDAVAQPGAPARPGQSESATSGDKRSTIELGEVRDKGAVLRDPKLPLVGEQVTNTEATSSAPTTLGQTARTILALLAQYPDSAPSITGKAPLWLPQTNNSKTMAASAEVTLPRAGEPTPTLLAQALRHALQNSGLFYESHLADLAFGRRTIAQLKSEPQAQLATASTYTGATFRASSNTDGPSSSMASSHNNAIIGINLEASLLVRQQLDVLAHQALAWRGDAWPGTPMEWAVERQNREMEGTAEVVQTWATRLRLDLPRLGMVEARLSLAGSQLVMQLVAPLAEPEINASADALRERLLAAGLTLSHLSVSTRAPQQRPDRPNEQPLPL